MATHSYENSLQPHFFCQTSSLSSALGSRRRARCCATVTQQLRKIPMVFSSKRSGCDAGRQSDCSLHSTRATTVGRAAPERRSNLIRPRTPDEARTPKKLQHTAGMQPGQPLKASLPSRRFHARDQAPVPHVRAGPRAGKFNAEMKLPLGCHKAAPAHKCCLRCSCLDFTARYGGAAAQVRRVFLTQSVRRWCNRYSTNSGNVLDCLLTFGSRLVNRHAPRAPSPATAQAVASLPQQL